MTDPSPPRKVAGIVLAAGKGTRMRSSLPKVLHRAAGRPMLSWVIEALRAAGMSQACVVLSEELSGFEEFLGENPELSVAIQANRLGTGDAVASAAFAFAGAVRAPFAAGRSLRGNPITSTHVLISAGDTPALSPPTLKRFVDDSLASGAPLSVLGMRVPDPKGYGRLLLDPKSESQVLEIVEERDATPEQRAINVCNSGIFFAQTSVLFELIAMLKADNSQKEYYLTDCISHARERGLVTRTVVSDDWQSFAGINDRRQLATVERHLVSRLLDGMMEGGVTVRSPDSVFVDADVSVGADTELGPGVTLTAGTRIGARCHVGAGATLAGCTLGDDAVVGAGCVLERNNVADGERIPALTARLG